MKKIKNALLTGALAILVGMTATSCQKDLVANEELLENTSISAEKLPRIYKFINIAFGVPSNQIRYDKVGQIIYYGDMHMSAGDMEKAYDKANVYKKQYEKL